MKKFYHLVLFFVSTTSIKAETKEQLETRMQKLQLLLMSH